MWVQTLQDPTKSPKKVVDQFRKITVQAKFQLKWAPRKVADQFRKIMVQAKLQLKWTPKKVADQFRKITVQTKFQLKWTYHSLIKFLSFIYKRPMYSPILIMHN